MKSPLTTSQLTHPLSLMRSFLCFLQRFFSVFTSYNKRAKVESDSPPRFLTKGNIKSELFCTFFSLNKMSYRYFQSTF